MLEFVQNRVANPVKLADWGDVEEGQPVVCPCCGWSARLGQCSKVFTEDSRAYSCEDCGMTLLARALPALVPFTLARATIEWRRADVLVVNY